MQDDLHDAAGYPPHDPSGISAAPAAAAAPGRRGVPLWQAAIFLSAIAAATALAMPIVATALVPSGAADAGLVSGAVAAGANPAATAPDSSPYAAIAATEYDSRSVAIPPSETGPTR